MQAAFAPPGITERWAAVQARLHPQLAALATAVDAAAKQRLPQLWPLYEVSFKSQRYINRGRGVREPIEDYFVAFDRPPRGAGVLVSLSAAERAVLVGLQLWGVRKPMLRRVWQSGAAVWQPLVERIAVAGQARFTERNRTEAAAGDAGLWIDRYLDSRSASYLWAGFVYLWDDLPTDLPARLVEDVLALLSLNEALMEQAEEHAPEGTVLLREQRTVYAAASATPPIETIIERISAQGFSYDEKIIRAYHIALQTRPLVILPGISGTGKTRLTRLYADAVHAIESPVRPNPYYLLVAVQPDWHNARDLLGYYNALTGVYHPTLFLQFLLRAAADPQQPYFVCLDEMNLARPEYYLAPLLSALETTEHSIDIGAPAPSVTSPTGIVISNPLRLPLNLRLTGTVNVDESTYTLSDKVLDRATVIELTAVDLAGFRARYSGRSDPAVWQTLVAVHAILTRAGQPFGYRVLNEILQYIEQAAGVLPPLEALDLEIKQKILPKLRGADNPRLRRALNELLDLLSAAATPFPAAADKVQRMRERLDEDGFTDFYG